LVVVDRKGKEWYNGRRDNILVEVKVVKGLYRGDNIGGNG
jgi:hypothetical protein